MGSLSWRYVTPCCKSSDWTRRVTQGTYYCERCQTNSPTLIDKKTGKRVSGVGRG